MRWVCDGTHIIYYCVCVCVVRAERRPNVLCSLQAHTHGLRIYELRTHFLYSSKVHVCAASQVWKTAIRKIRCSIVYLVYYIHAYVSSSSFRNGDQFRNSVIQCRNSRCEFLLITRAAAVVLRFRKP